METSTKPAKAASLVAIGATLKKTRESKSLTIDQVQKKTRIHATVLLALEEGSCETLMSATYARSFLKTYAGFLGLNTEELMKEYSALRQPQQYASAPPVIAPMLRPPRQEQAWTKGTDTFLKILYAVSFIVLLAVAILFAVFVWKKASAAFKGRVPQRPTLQ
jgi:cytoskeletal protein RodZ